MSEEQVDFDSFENPNQVRVPDLPPVSKDIAVQEDSELQQLPPSAMVMVEQTRAIQEIQAAFIIAKRFPRDLNAAYTRIMTSCKRLSLAEKAMYKYPRGGAIVTGPSIRLAEVLAQGYGNLDFGIREIERRPGVSIVESYCRDLETNTIQKKTFEVPHELELKGGKKKKLTSERDIYELAANMGARRLRSCILGIIPTDFKEDAIKQCEQTVRKGGGEPIEDRIKKMVLAFKELGVSQEMLEKYLTHKMDVTNLDEIVELQSIWTSIKDKQSKRSEFFDYPDEDQTAETEAVINKLKGKS